MKTAIYIEDGLVQLVLTPESDWEQSALASFKQNDVSAKIFDGTFYACSGGWMRQNHNWGGYHEHSREYNSLILHARSVDPQASLPMGCNNGASGEGLGDQLPAQDP